VAACPLTHGPGKWAILVLKLKKPRTEHWNRAFQIFALFV
jgi:hypothetical protein